MSHKATIDRKGQRKVNIGIIVYSRTGHTLAVATQLKEKLSAAGHEVKLEQVEVVGPDNLGATDVQLKIKPEVEGYGIVPQLP